MKYKLRILGTDWTVEETEIPIVDDNSSTEDFGSTNFVRREIKVSSRNDPLKHLIHEILEVLKTDLRIKIIHDDIDRIATGLACVIRENEPRIKRVFE